MIYWFLKKKVCLKILLEPASWGRREYGLRWIWTDQALIPIWSKLQGGSNPFSMLQLSGIFTELGVLYARYRLEKLMEHIKIFYTHFKGQIICGDILRQKENEDNKAFPVRKRRTLHTFAYYQRSLLKALASWKQSRRKRGMSRPPIVYRIWIRH